MIYSTKEATTVYETTSRSRIGVDFYAMADNKAAFSYFQEFVDNLPTARVFCVPKQTIQYCGKEYTECSVFYNRGYAYKIDASISYSVQSMFDKIIKLLNETNAKIYILCISSKLVGMDQLGTIYEWTADYIVV